MSNDTAATTLPNLSPDDLKRLNATMDAGQDVLQQIDDLSTGLKEQVKSLAEEFGLKPAPFMKAIKTRFKNKLADDKAAMSLVEEILEVTGHS